ncbi:hypothetical protein [Umezawaea beigongshangensis]|uniref:8-oxoguanine DNA glycosylase OGG fold protein n=1 Tax=Umezawaea beigongshangensis TaxID=2780383 RepID=UPI0018F216A8|nr:hypothetical protein [Umezawaea beigongshangensis]
MTTLEPGAVFRGDPPPRDGPYLLGQRVRFDERSWTSHLPDASLWPRELAGRDEVSRRTLFTVARDAVNEPGAARTLVAAAVWQHAPKSRFAAVLGRLVREPVGQHLAAAVRTARTSPADAFAQLTRKGELALPELTADLFTPVLHFAVYGESGPLVLDRYVVTALNALRGTDWSPDGPWSPEQYGDYLAVAAEWAAAWGSGTTTDVVERTLSAAGRALGSAFG